MNEWSLWVEVFNKQNAVLTKPQFGRDTQLRIQNFVSSLSENQRCQLMRTTIWTATPVWDIPSDSSDEAGEWGRDEWRRRDAGCSPSVLSSSGSICSDDDFLVHPQFVYFELDLLECMPWVPFLCFCPYDERLSLGCHFILQIALPKEGTRAQNIMP